MYDTRSKTTELQILFNHMPEQTNSSTPILQAQSQHGIYYPQIFLRLKL